MTRLSCYLALGLTGTLPAEDAPATGDAIYQKHCVSCHGKNGEGNPDECDEPLYGERSLASLAKYIHKRMPKDKPELVLNEDARKVAEYIYGKFYSAEARAKSMPPPEMAFARLTNRQFRESVADLLGSFAETPPPGVGRGLKAQYFDSDGMNKKARKVLEREDRELSFDFGNGPPVDGAKSDQYSIMWNGSLIAPATGWHEFRLSTPNGARLYLNGESQQGPGIRRDDSGEKSPDALIDSWVSSGSEVRGTGARVFLLGGRCYQIRLDYFKYLDARGMVKLEWKQPRGEWAVLAAPYLSPAGAAHVAVVDTVFPADDASEGYERGTGISKEWHEATTNAAIAVANEVVARLPRLSGVQDNAPDRAERLKAFIAIFAERAFRRPLDEPQCKLYVEHPFAGGVAPEDAVKRAVILILKSPRFLYPELVVRPDDFSVASRLALGMWDSLPDKSLLDSAGKGQLRTAKQVETQVRRMVGDPRTKAKLNEFFQGWLKLDVESDLRKDPQAFPGFDDAMVADLRRSLELFVELVVWSGKSDYRELITADYLLLNDRLARFYGVPMPEGGGFQPVKFDPAQRSGVLTHPYVLARLSHPDVTSPIHRGVFITRNVLGGFLKPPPEAIAFENRKFDPKMTMREKVAEMTRSASCMTCHETINPLGFSLENFDPVGRFRTTEGGRPINPAAEFLTAEGEILVLTGPRDVANHAVNSETARTGFIRQLLQFTLKQNPAVYGPETIHRLDTAFTASGFSVRNLLADINALAALHGIPDPDQASQ